MKYLILLLLVSCSTVNTNYSTDKQLLPYINKFNKLYNKYNHSNLLNDIDVRLTTIPESEVAKGVYYVHKDYVIINSKYWNKLSSYKKEIVVFHELGHYILKRTHDWTQYRMMSNGCPRSMMYYMGVSDKCYKKYYKYYLRELFQRR